MAADTSKPSSSAATDAKAAPQQEAQKMEDFVSVTLHRPLHGIDFIVVGCGGTGARVVPALCQMINPEVDTISVIDHDIVEERNLLRQNFVARDVGRNKAEVMALRYSRNGLNIVPYTMMLDWGMPWVRILQDASSRSGAASALRNMNAACILGCVDNKRARRVMAGLIMTMSHSPMIYIDAGNSYRDGQVLMSFSDWPAFVEQNGVPLRTPKRRGTTVPEGATRWWCYGLEAMPQLFLGEDPREGDDCTRIDTQTLAVNMMAASSLINCVGLVLGSIPFSTVGSFFSSFNSMQAIRIAGLPGGAEGVGTILHPVMNFADGSMESLWAEVRKERYGAEIRGERDVAVSFNAATRLETPFNVEPVEPEPEEEPEEPEEEEEEELEE